MAKNRRVLFLLPVLAVAGWLALFGDKTPPAAQVTGVAEPVQGGVDSGPAADTAVSTEDARPGAVLRLHDRVGLVKYENLPRIDLFQGRSVEQIQAAAEEQKKAAEVAPPEKPRQPFRVIGRMLESGQWLVFLEHSGRTYVAQSGSIVEGFRVASVSDQKLELTNLAAHTDYVIQIGDNKKEPEDE